MASTTRPRRTRVYDANYNIGQSLYKPTLAKLDQKYSGGSLDTGDFFKASSPLLNATRASPQPRPRFNLEEAIDEDLKSARARANRAITEESIFDRAGRNMKGFSRAGAFDSDIDEEIREPLARMRANKPKISAMLNELDLDEPMSTFKRRPRADFGEKILDAVNGEDYGSNVMSFKSRAVKAVSRTEQDSSESFEKSAASMRANQTKARLAEVENDMYQRSEKQLEREKRASNLKKILADNDIEPVKALRKVTF